MRREKRLGMPGGFVEGTTRRVVMFVQALCGTSRVLRVVVVDRRRRTAAPRRPGRGSRRARFVTGSHVDEGRAGRRKNYAQTLWKEPGFTLDDIREAVTTLEETERIARRVLGKSYPLTIEIEKELRDTRAAQAALRARETPSGSA